MAHNETLYRFAREALDDGLTLAALLDDIDAVITAYAQGCADDADAEAARRLEVEAHEAVAIAESIASSLLAMSEGSEGAYARVIGGK